MIYIGQKKTQILVSYNHLACVGTPLQTLKGADISHDGFFHELYPNIFKSRPSPSILTNPFRNYSGNKVNFSLYGYHHLTCFCSWWYRAFDEKFALKKTYQIVRDVPHTLLNTSPPISAADTQVWLNRYMGTACLSKITCSMKAKVASFGILFGFLKM